MILPFWPTIDDVLMGAICACGLVWEVGTMLGEFSYEYYQRRQRQDRIQ